MHEQGTFAAALLCRSARILASGAVERQQQRDPDGVRTYGKGIHDLTADTEVRIGYLAEALATDRVQLFTEQLGWLKVLCAARGIAAEQIQDNLECMRAEIEERLPEDAARRAAAMLQTGIDHVARAPAELESHLAGAHPHIDLARQFLLAVLEAREDDAVRLVLDAFDGGTSLEDIHEHVLHRAQLEIGRMWQMNEVTIAEEHYCTGIVTTLFTLLRARTPRAEPNGNRVITASVSSETHDFGIRLASHAFERAGWTTLTLGANTPTVALAEAVRDFGCDLLALSTSMVLYVRRTAEMIADLREHPITARIPILVGGQPFNVVDDLWQVVGADGHARTAFECPRIGGELLGARA